MVRAMKAHNFGFTFVAVMAMVAIFALASAVVAQRWSQIQKREREQELLYIGHQFREAIRHYYEESPGMVQQYPGSLNDLLRDDRYLTLKRYLRKIYRDPMTASTQWGLVQVPQGAGIMGVYSLSQEMSIKTGGFGEVDKALEGKSRYQDWKFVYEPPALGDAAAPSQGTAGNPASLTNPNAALNPTVVPAAGPVAAPVVPPAQQGQTPAHVPAPGPADTSTPAPAAPPDGERSSPP
jgi:type II secretory pathway pseudopilin PulG